MPQSTFGNVLACILSSNVQCFCKIIDVLEVRAFILHCIPKITMSSTVLLTQYKSTAKRCECNAGNCKLALDHDVYPPSQTDGKSVARKLVNSWIHMPTRLQHAMSALLSCPPQPVLFPNLQVLNAISLLQTLSLFLRHCPQIREVCNISTQPEQFHAWADLRCCNTLEQMEQVVLQ